MSSTQTIKSDTSEFGKIRAALWPIHKYELKKFLPLAFIMFCILFNYTLLRDTKDTIVVNSAGAGAISFLKLYCVTPAAILFVIIYAKLTKSFQSRKCLLCRCNAILGLFRRICLRILYPNLDSLHLQVLHQSAALKASYPSMCGFIDIYAYWVLFSVLCALRNLGKRDDRPDVLAVCKPRCTHERIKAILRLISSLSETCL